MSLTRWERMTQWPLIGVACLFLVAYAWSTIDVGLPATAGALCNAMVTTSWVIFAADYLVRLLLAPRRWIFVRSNLLDLAAVALPALRPLRLLRLFALVGVVHRTIGASLRGRVAIYVGGATSFVIFLAALAVLDAERSAPDASIITIDDALWWAMTTVTTVGYGDLYPVTIAGRFVAVALMLCGIALLGTVTASLASWFLDRVREVEEHSQNATRRDVALLTQEVMALRRELAAERDPTFREDSST